MSSRIRKPDDQLETGFTTESVLVEGHTSPSPLAQFEFCPTDGIFTIDPFAKLSPREREVLVAYIETRNPKEMALQLGTKLQTVRNQLASIEAKCEVAGREDLLAMVLMRWIERRLIVDATMPIVGATMEK